MSGSGDKELKTRDIPVRSMLIAETRRDERPGGETRRAIRPGGAFQHMHLLPVTHKPGRHCASTAISDLMNYRRVPWSEALCFGIGAGLGIWYLRFEDSSPRRLVHVRSGDIEEQFFTRIGLPFKWQRFEGMEASERALCEALDAGRPALVQTDIYHLPYYNSRTHFPGHVIAVWGYDYDRRVFLITDTERPELLEVPFDNMAKARFCRLGFFNIKGNLYALERLAAPEDLPGVIVKAIVHNSKMVLESGEEYRGLRALGLWKRELEEWKGFEDWRWTARFAYQVIERRGTGGGGFRAMYADFLDEVAGLVPDVSSLGLNGRMKNTARAWSELALALRDTSEGPELDVAAVRGGIERVERLEEDYHRCALGLSG